MEEINQPPIKYPTVEVPGKGTYTVKFGLGAMYTLENDLGMSLQDVGTKIREWFPSRDAEGNQVPGKASGAFLLKVLSACMWDQVHMTPRELGDAFEIGDLAAIARVIAEAFSKTRWSPQIPLREAATLQGQPN